MQPLNTSKRVPYHVISTLNDLNSTFPLNNWDPQKLLKILQEAVVLKHKIKIPSTSILLNLRSIKTDSKTQKAITNTVLRLIFTLPLHVEIHLHDDNQLAFLTHKAVSKELLNAKPQWQAYLLADIQHFFKNPKRYQSNVITALNTIGFPEYRDVLEHAKRFLQTKCPLATILIEINNIPREKRTETVASFFELGGSHLESGQVEVLRELAKSNPLIRESFVNFKNANQLLEFKDGHSLRDILYVFNEVPLKTIRSLMDLSQTLLNSTSFNYGVFWALTKVPPAELHSLVELLKGLSCCDGDIIKLVLAIKPELRGKFIARLQLIFPNVKDSHFLADLFYFLQAIPDTEWKQVAECARTLIDLNIHDSDRLSILTQLMKLHPSQREDFLSDIIWAMQNQFEHLAAIVQELCFCDREERDFFFTYLYKHSTYNRKEVFRELQRFTISERIQILEHAKPLLTEDTIESTISALFRQLSTVPYSEIKDLIDVGLPLCQNERGNFEHIKTLSLIPKEERKELVEFVLKLNVELTYNERLFCLQECACIPKTQRIDFFELCKGIDRSNYKMLVQLRSCHPQDRKYFMELSARLAQQKGWSSQYMVMFELIKIPSISWGEAIENEAIFHAYFETSAHRESYLTSAVKFSARELHELLPVLKPFITTAGNPEDHLKYLSSLKYLRVLKNLALRIPLIQPVLKGIKNDLHLSIAWEFLDIPPDELKVLIPQIAPFMKSSLTGSDFGVRRDIVLNVYRSVSQRNRFVISDLLELTRDISTHQIPSFMRRLLNEYPATELRSLRKHYPLIKRFSNDSHERFIFIGRLLGIPFAEREEIIDMAQSINCRVEEYDEIIIKLIGIPRRHRRDIFNTAQMIYSAIPQTSSQAFSVFSFVLSGLREIPHDERSKAIEDFFKYFSHHVQNASSILEGIGSMSASKRTRLIEYLQPIFSLYPGSLDRHELMIAFKNVPEEEWDSLRDFFMEFIHSKITINAINFEEFQRIGIAKSRGILSSFKSLVSSLTTSSDLASFVKFMDAIDEEDRHEMLLLARSLLLNTYSKASVVLYAEVAKSLFQLGSTKRKILFEEGRFLIYGLQPHPKNLLLLNVLAEKLTPENLVDILRHVKTLRCLIRPDIFVATFSDIINTLSQISYERRQYFVIEARYWLRDANETQQILYTLRCLLAAEHSRSKSILEHMDLFIPGQGVDMEYMAVSHIHQLLEKYPTQHRTIYQKLNLLRLKNKVSAKMYAALKEIPLDKWDRLIELTDMLMRGYDAIYPFMNILKQLNSMTSEQINRIDDWKPYLQGHSISPFFGEWIKTMISADSKKLDAVLKIFHSTEWPKAWDNHSELIKYLVALNEEHLAIVEKVKPRMGELDSLESFIQLMDVLKQIEPMKQTAFMEFALRFKPHYRHFTNLEEVFRKIPFRRLMKMVEVGAPVLNLLRNDRTLGQFITELNAIEEDEWSGAVNLVQPFYLENGLENYNGPTALSTLIKLTPQQREEVISIAHPLISTFTNHKNVVHILDALVHAPLTLLKEIPKYSLAYNLPFFPGVAGAFITSLGRLLPEINEIGLETRFAPIMNTYGSVRYKVIFISELNMFTQGLYDDLMTNLLMGFPRIDFRYHQNLMKLYSLVNSRYWPHVNEIFMNHKDELESQLLNRLFANRELRDASIEHLLKITEKEIENLKLIDEISNSIIVYAHSLRLDEEHPLFQRAIEMRCILSDNIQDTRNPYVLHQRLRKILSEEILIEPPVCTASFSDFKIAPDLNTIRSHALKRVYTIKDLPHHIPSDAFHTCFDKLLNRLKMLPEQNRQATIKYIKDGYLSPPERLRELFLEKPVIMNMLGVKDSMDRVIEPTVFYLYAILKFLMDQDDVLKPGQLLTEREDRLCQISCSINECPTGQRDGIVGYYNRLPIAYRASEEILRNSEAKVTDMIDSIMQSVLYDTCAEPALVAKITEESRISYGPHQTLYLMNRLHRQIGLRHRLVFDLNAGIVYQKLIEAPLDVLLKKFFEVFDLRKVIKRLRNEIAEGFKNKNIVYMDLANVLEPCVKAFYKLEKLNPELFAEYFELSDELEPKGLTEKGAVFLMMGTQYLKVIK
jgi:hypothetical protein